MSSTKKCRKPAKRGQHSQRAEARRHLSFDPLVTKIRERAEAIPDGRSHRCDFSLADAVMSAFAMFSLKDPSLLAFEKRRNDENIKTLFFSSRFPPTRTCENYSTPYRPICSGRCSMMFSAPCNVAMPCGNSSSMMDVIFCPWMAPNTFARKSALLVVPVQQGQ
jgi:hypothetical protein